MNNLISIIMSVILYNPLEAAVLLLASWFFKPHYIERGKFDFKIFLVKSYIIGTLNLLAQTLETNSQETIYYGLVLLLVGYGFMSLTLKLFGYKNKYFHIIIIMFLFNISLSFIIDICQLPTLVAVARSNFWGEFFANIAIRSGQLLILFILVGGYKMFREKLVKDAKRNLGKMVASTTRTYGEPKKLAEKLKAEIVSKDEKESK